MATGSIANVCNLVPPSQCAATSIGTANQLFMTVIQTFLTAQCGFSLSDMWPKDYGEIALKNGNNTYYSFLEFIGYETRTL